MKALQACSGLPRLVPGDDGLADVIQTLQKVEGIGRIVKSVPVLCQITDLLQADLRPRLEGQPVNPVDPGLVPAVLILGEQPAGISELFHSTPADNA